MVQPFATHSPKAAHTIPPTSQPLPIFFNTLYKALISIIHSFLTFNSFLNLIFILLKGGSLWLLPI